MYLIVTYPVMYSASSVIWTSLIRTLAFPNFIHGRSDITKLLTHPQYWCWAQALHICTHALALQRVWFCMRIQQQAAARRRSNSMAASTSTGKQNRVVLSTEEKADVISMLDSRSSLTAIARKHDIGVIQTFHLSEPPSPPRGSDNWGCTVCMYLQVNSFKK